MDNVTILPFVSMLPILLVHLAGVVVAIILLVRHRGTPAIMALVGFAVLFIMDLVSFSRPRLTMFLARQVGMRQFAFVNTGVGCCCSVFDVLAIVCLIVAIWQAASGAATGEA